MITRERAVQLAEALPARSDPPPAVAKVQEHPLGWLVFWQSADYLRTRKLRYRLVGHGPYLVDREDGSIHHIPAATYRMPGWDALYREQVRGAALPDPLLPAVRDLVSSQGVVAAMRHLRQEAPQLTLTEAKAYVDAVRDGTTPPKMLTDRTRSRSRRFAAPIETLTGPAD